MIKFNIRASARPRMLQFAKSFKNDELGDFIMPPAKSIPSSKQKHKIKNYSEIALNIVW